jgi:membrane-bound metal-dependent hydrolase YbcI (DUF457 family)
VPRHNPKRTRNSAYAFLGSEDEFLDHRGYNLAALLFFFLFLDNLLRRIEGQGWKWFWPCSGRFEVVVLFGMLSLVTQFVYWSRIVSGLNQEHA